MFSTSPRQSLHTAISSPRRHSFCSHCCCCISVKAFLKPLLKWWKSCEKLFKNISLRGSPSIQSTAVGVRSARALRWQTPRSFHAPWHDRVSQRLLVVFGTQCWGCLCGGRWNAVVDGAQRVGLTRAGRAGGWALILRRRRCWANGVARLKIENS